MKPSFVLPFLVVAALPVFAGETAVTAGAGYTFADVPWKPRIGLEYKLEIFLRSCSTVTVKKGGNQCKAMQS